MLATSTKLHARLSQVPSSRIAVRSPIARSRRVIMRAADGEKTVLVPVGNGSEEMEAVIVVDVLRRAGAKVTMASVEGKLEVVCSRGIKLVADDLIDNVTSSKFDMIALPGGMPGAERLRDCAALEKMMKEQMESGKLLSAICATPAVFLQAKGFMEGKKGTAHPAFADKMQDQSCVNDRVVVDGNLTTSRGPGTAFEFALSLVSQLYGEQKMQQVAGPMVLPK